MANKTSKIQFVNKSNAVEVLGRNESLINTLRAEQAQYAAIQANYQLFSKMTLGDSPVVIAGMNFGAFRGLIEIGVAQDGKKLLTFNPAGTTASVSTGSAYDVNALRDAFGTKRYSVLEYGLHERTFDRSKTFESNVRSEKGTDGKWRRYNWNNRSFVESTPKLFEGWDDRSKAIARANREEYDNWVGKHEAIDKMLIALLSGQKYIVKFFDDWTYNRLVNNVLNMMDKTITEVVEKASTNVAGAVAARTLELESATVDLASSVCIIDGVDTRGFTLPFSVTVKAPYAEQPWVKGIDPSKDYDLKWLVKATQDKSLELHLVA